MNGINLIPAARLTGQRGHARVRYWVAIAPICAAGLTAAYGYLALTWETHKDDLVAKQAALAVEVEAAKVSVDRGKAAAEQAAATAWANKAVAEQPDWGVLLALLAGDLDDSTVLSSVDLRPDAKEARKAPGVSRDSLRPERYIVLITGYAKQQEGVSQFVLKLERLGLFDAVTLKEARRTTLLATDALEFRVECAVSDSTGGIP